MTDALKPCPFCGGEAACIEETDWEIGCYNGQCATQPSVWMLSKERAIAAWNTRAATPLNDPRVKALVEALKEAERMLAHYGSRDAGGMVQIRAALEAIASPSISALEENK